ncbi:hypothetical protein Y032_0405g879 [Ancylostoma ceylanicum]|uniref:Brinker DNA-binding domain-containing protein n=1 Tax=Ancylostoma ceylanicum TaxID=53326 RepID=A0A016X2Q4_9BILA|nr:hypothetical protein Y032_0405g879 [Ancylostoma ceylanicum]
MAGGATRNARKSRKRKNSEDSTSAAPSRTLKQYSVDEKLEIIEFAKGNGNRAAGREYNVAESSIREWRKNEEKLRSVNSTDSERSRQTEMMRKVSAGPVEGQANGKGPEFVQVSLSTSLASGLPKSNGIPADPDRKDVPSTASSSSGSHSNSPLFTAGSSSSRRKAKAPRKMVIES